MTDAEISAIDEDRYLEYRDRVMELAGEVTRMEDGEYVHELRSDGEVAAMIDELSPAEVAEIRAVARADAPYEWYETADRSLEDVQKDYKQR